MANIDVQRSLLTAITEWIDNINRIINDDYDPVNDSTENKLFEIYKIIQRR